MERLTTLWMGDVLPWMDEVYMKNLWTMMGDPLVQVRIIKDRNTGLNVGYCFIDFSSHEMAAHMLSNYNNRPIPGIQGFFRLNWATGSFISGSSASSGYYGNQTDLSIWVGDLSPEVDDLTLLTFFQQHYKSVRSARVVLDNTTMISRGFGFVRFMDEQDFHRALSEMNGQVLMGRCIKIALGASAKRSAAANASIMIKSPMSTTSVTSTGSGGGGGLPITPVTPNAVPPSEPSNVLMVRGLPETATKYALKQHFSKFGSVLQVDLIPCNGVSLIVFDSHIPVRYLLGKEFAYEGKVSCFIGTAPARNLGQIVTEDTDLDLEELDYLYYHQGAHLHPWHRL